MNRALAGLSVHPLSQKPQVLHLLPDKSARQTYLLASHYHLMFPKNQKIPLPHSYLTILNQQEKKSPKTLSRHYHMTSSSCAQKVDFKTLEKSKLENPAQQTEEEEEGEEEEPTTR